MALAWLFLILSIITEVAGTLTMNASGHSGSVGAYGLMYFFIICSYTLFSFAIRKIAVGIAIAIWEGLGVLLITSISILFLHEQASPQKLIGLSMALCGIVLLNFGESHE